MSNGNYINNKEFLNSLKKFQEENLEEHSQWFKKMKPKNESQRIFKEKCAIRRTQRIEDLQGESEEHRIARHKRLDRTKNDIGHYFMRITEGLAKKPCFINYDYNRKQEMMSDASYYMTIYIDRYDCTRSNPFAYFTQIAFNAFLQNINKVNKNREVFTSLAYIENLDNPNGTDNW